MIMRSNYENRIILVGLKPRLGLSDPNSSQLNTRLSSLYLNSVKTRLKRPANPVDAASVVDTHGEESRMS